MPWWATPSTQISRSPRSALFQVDPVSLLTTNAIDISFPDVENHILPSHLFLKIPVTCSCVDGCRKSVSTKYKTPPSDTLDSGQVSADQIRDSNSIPDPTALDIGETLVVPLPCTCFNSTDNFLPLLCRRGTLSVLASCRRGSPQRPHLSPPWFPSPLAVVVPLSLLTSRCRGSPRPSPLTAVIRRGWRCGGFLVGEELTILLFLVKEDLVLSIVR